MAVMNDVQQSTEPKSPTTLVMEYLRTKGINPGGPNYSQSVRSALQENARNGGKLIPGLINQDPGEEENTKAPTGGPGVGRGGGSSVASKVEGGGSVDTRSGDQRGGGSSGGGDQKTSAPPPAATLPLDDRDPPLAALNRAENPRIPADVKNIYADDPELGPGGALGAGLGGLGGALGVGGAGLAAAIMSGQGLPRVPSGAPPIVALPPVSSPAPPAPQMGPPVPPDMIAPSAQGPEIAPNVPFQSAGPRQVPIGPPIARSGPPGITFGAQPPTLGPPAPGGQPFPPRVPEAPPGGGSGALKALLEALGRTAKFARP